MKIYISGPITGKPDAKNNFDRVADVIRIAGHTPINPVDVSGWELDWLTCLQIAFAVLSSGQIGAVYMLRGWQGSHGACLERYWSRLNGVPIIYQTAEDRKAYGTVTVRGAK